MHWHSAIYLHLKGVVINSPWKFAFLTLKLLFIRMSVPLLPPYKEIVLYASGLFSYLMDTANRIIHS